MKKLMPNFRLAINQDIEKLRTSFDNFSQEIHRQSKTDYQKPQSVELESAQNRLISEI